MLRPHELDVDGPVLVPTRSTRIDQELDVNALLVHVADASVGVPVVAIQVRILSSHEAAGGPASGGARLRLAQHARDVRSPAADRIAAEAEAPRVGRLVLHASRVPPVGHFAALQVWH